MTSHIVDANKMSPELREWFERSGAIDLPWKRTPAVNVEKWTLEAKPLLLVVTRGPCIDDKIYELFGLHEWDEDRDCYDEFESGSLGCGRHIDSHFKDAVDRVVPVLRYNEARERNLSRLSHLPEDLRAVAVRFLDLHECWDTRFEANHSYCLELLWRGPKQSARLEWMSRSYFGDGYGGEAWMLFWRVGENKLQGRRSEQGPLRRSHDFVEFVRRFTE